MLEREYQVHVDPDADEKMLGYINFLGQVSVSAAERLFYKLSDGIKSLDFNPDGYPRYPARKKIIQMLRYCLCDKQRYRLIFDVIDDTVHVHDVQDCRQHPNKSLV